MTHEKGFPYQRHKPSAALREFLDPLEPGSYFDCGRARLRGLDDALLAEAKSRGRAIGDDSFQMVATDMGLIYCRPSISFAIAAHWDEVVVDEPIGDGPVVLVVQWPTHGELRFTVGTRLAGNIYRRYRQLQDLDLEPEEGPEPEEGLEPEEGSEPESERPAGPSEALTGQDPTDDVAPDAPLQGPERVAATVAEAASVAVNRRTVSSRRPTEPVPDRRSVGPETVAGRKPAVARTPAARASGVSRASGADREPRGEEPDDLGGPETWEMVTKLAAPARHDRTVRTPTKRDRRQGPDTIRRRRKEKALDARRRQRSDTGGVDRGGADQRRSDGDRRDEPMPTAQARWLGELDLPPDPDPGDGAPGYDDPDDGAPVYDIPPLQSPDPSRPMRPGVRHVPSPVVRPDRTGHPSLGPTPAPPKVDRPQPGATGPDQPFEEPADPAPVHWELVEDVADPNPNPNPNPDPAPVASAAPIGDGIFTSASPVAEAEPPRPKAYPIEYRSSQNTDGAQHFDGVEEFDGAEQFDGAEELDGVEELDRGVERPWVRELAVRGQGGHEPSWIGSPGSLVTAMVVISSLVLIVAIGIGSYRQAEPVVADIDPAGPSVSVVDHQRFRPDEDRLPTASDRGQPEVSRYSQTTSPSTTVGSGTAPIAADPDWAPEDGARACNSNYSGCVPDVEDVDCPNDGDGPIYWSESARVMGADVYELDTDGDGEICEPDQPPLTPAG